MLGVLWSLPNIEVECLKQTIFRWYNPNDDHQSLKKSHIPLKIWALKWFRYEIKKQCETNQF